MKGLPLFISALIHLCGGAILGFELVQPAQFMSAAPAPSLAVGLVDAAIANTVEPQSEPAPPPPMKRDDVLPKPRKEVRKVKEQPVRSVPQLPVAAVVSQGKQISDSQGTVLNSAVVKASPDYLRNPPPVYPEECRRKREEGLVLLAVNIAADGSPTQVRVKESSHYERLDRAALRAVSGWRFKSATVAGVPIASEVDVPIRFSLRER